MRTLQAGIVAVAALILAALPARADSEAEFLLASAALEQVATLLPSPSRSYGRLAYSANAQDGLLELLDDRDPAVRAQAAKALKHFVLTDSRVERKLLELLDRSGEPDLSRREAIKSLAWAAQHYEVERKLLELARDWRQSADIRVVAFKALYVIARNDSIAQALVSALQDDRTALQIRMAAAWALFASLDNRSRTALVEMAKDKSETEFLRVEAVKSLAPHLADYRARETVLGLVKDSSERLMVRQTAVLSLVMINQDYHAKSWLEEAARREPNPTLRHAAIQAMGGLTLELARYFHLSWYNRRFIDPLEDQ